MTLSLIDGTASSKGKESEKVKKERRGGKRK